MLEVWWKKLWRIEVHLHRECYGYSKIGEKTWRIAVIHQIRQRVFAANVFYCNYRNFIIEISTIGYIIETLGNIIKYLPQSLSVFVTS